MSRQVFDYRDGTLFGEHYSLAKIAEQFGTPAYVYSRSAIVERFRAYAHALGDHPHLICYAVKANSNLAVLSTLAAEGAGFDIVSVGELERVLAAGGDPNKVVFSGVAKTAAEMRRALEAGIHCFNVESEGELLRLDGVAAECGLRAKVSLRVNPDVDARTHPYISTGLRENKFGVAIEKAFDIYKQAAAMAHIDIVGVDCHIGSQLTELAPFLDALDRLLVLVDRLAAEGIEIQHLDLGGGLGVSYRDEAPPEPAEYIDAVRKRLGDRALTLVFEPGRSIVANAGVLLTRVEYLKHNEERHFAIVDAAMNDMLRPALYEAWLAIDPVQPRKGESQLYDIVGPVCETGDFLGKSRALCLQVGDLLAVRGAGAYGFSMSSNYNTRPRAVEVMLNGDEAHLIRQRETLSSLFADELIPDFS